MEIHAVAGPDEAAEALQHVRSGRLAAARRVPTPWWYHPLVGVTLALLVGSGSLRGPARIGLLVAAAAAMAGLFWSYRRLTGLWINLLTIPGTRRSTVLATAVALTLFALGTWLEDGAGVGGALAGAGVLLGVAYTLYWRWAERELVRLWQATS